MYTVSDNTVGKFRGIMPLFSTDWMERTIVANNNSNYDHHLLCPLSVGFMALLFEGAQICFEGI